MNRVATCIAVILVGAFSITIAEEHQPAQSIALDKNSIAILPIEVLTDDPKGAALALDAYEELLRQLASVENLNVIQHDRVESFRDSELSASEIARELGAANVVQGDIQLMPPYYVLQLRFVDAQGNRPPSPTSPRSRSGTSSLIGVTDPSIKCAINPETALPDGISDVVTSVEQWLYPVAEPTREQRAIAARAKFLDDSESDQARLRSMGEFAPPRMGGAYPVQYFGSAEVMTGAVAVVAVQLGLHSKDEGVRHGVWWRMAGVGDLYLVEPLMASLRNDDDVWVRAQAAMTLVDFLEEPGVRETLDYARTNDSEKMVRRAANFSMLSPSERLTNLKETVLDPTESDWDRMAALNQLRPSFPEDEAHHEELVNAAMKLAKNSRDSRVRQGVWANLSKTNEPVIVAALIAALKEDPSERVREGVAMSLSFRLIDEPGVREAIEDAKANDASPLVRKRAEETLAAQR
jgi:TolB-like protein/HEAT repeat protein